MGRTTRVPGRTPIPRPFACLTLLAIMAAFLVGDVAPAPADPPQPQLSINDVTQNEGNSGTTSFVFTVTRSGVTSGTSTVNYATGDDSATGGPSCSAPGDVDYTPTNGILTFNPGDTSKTITVMACGDTTVEPNETFFVNLSGATGATITDSQGVGTILDDDSNST